MNRRRGRKRSKKGCDRRRSIVVGLQSMVIIAFDRSKVPNKKKSEEFRSISLPLSPFIDGKRTDVAFTCFM